MLQYPSMSRLPTPCTPKPRRVSFILLSSVLLFTLLAVGAYLYLTRKQTSLTPPPLSAGLRFGDVTGCHPLPKFAAKLGYNQSAIFTTSDRVFEGLVMLQPNAQGDLNSADSYRAPTWSSAGYLGPLAFDRQGNLYVAPTPFISLTDNPPAEQNKIYRLDNETGIMSEFLNLRAAQPPSSANPYGVMGLAYDCDTNALYASSIAGSTRTQELGRIYRIDLTARRVSAEYDNLDALGLAVYNQPTGKRLYLGRARAPQVDSILLDASGDFWGEPRAEFTLSGPYNIPRTIQFDPHGQMLIRGYDFNFTLSASREERSTTYHFQYDPAADHWSNLNTP